MYVLPIWDILSFTIFYFEKKEWHHIFSILGNLQWNLETCPNTEFFLVRIQSECEKIRTRKNSVFGHFPCSMCHRKGNNRGIARGILFLGNRAGKFSICRERFRIISLKFEKVKLETFCHPWVVIKTVIAVDSQFSLWYEVKNAVRDSSQWMKWIEDFINLTLSWRRLLSCRNQSIDFRSKSMNWFLYDNGLRHERVNRASLNGSVCYSVASTQLIYIFKSLSLF